MPRVDADFMVADAKNSPLIVIVGETASGKSSLAMEIAKKFNGEVIAADSRTIYKGMDIGTAKPTSDDMVKVPHHLINVVTPCDSFTVADYKRLAEKSIESICSRSKLPIIVGGTGLYVDSVIYDFSLTKRPDPKTRERLQLMTVEELQSKILSMGLKLPNNPKNPRHLIRQIERKGAAPESSDLRVNTLVIGIRTDIDELKKRIADRVDQMMAEGLEGEVRRLFDEYGADCPGLRAIGYQEFADYLVGRITLADVRELIITHTLQYAKRQRTWFRRNHDIHYISKKAEGIDLITTFLNKVYVAN